MSFTHHSCGWGCIPNVYLEPLWHPSRQSPGQGCPAPIITSCPSLEHALRHPGDSLSRVLQEEVGAGGPKLGVCEGVQGWMSPVGARSSLPCCCESPCVQ